MKPPKDLFVQREPYAADMFAGWEQPAAPDNIHYRQVLPGEVTITREEFIAKVGGLTDSDTLADVLDEIFGPSRAPDDRMAVERMKHRDEVERLKDVKKMSDTELVAAFKATGQEYCARFGYDHATVAKQADDR